MSAAARRFWEKRKDRFQFIVKVPHMSKRDVDPRKFGHMTTGYFMRVPFDGIAHWAFRDEITRDLFLKVGRSS